MGQRLPNVVLHRVLGEPCPGKDVDVYERDGVQYVSPSRRGVSFLRLDDNDTARRIFHGLEAAACSVTAPGVQLSEGFAMVQGAPLRWPPPMRGIQRHEQLGHSSVIGRHYTLVPLVDMPLVQYAAELERITSSACGMAAAAGMVALASGGVEEPLPSPADWLKPSERRMVYVAFALLALCEDQAEPASVRSTAWLVLASICAADTSFAELLLQPDMAAWALTAMEQYEPPEDDLVGDSICQHVWRRLQEALESPHPPAAVA